MTLHPSTSATQLLEPASALSGDAGNPVATCSGKVGTAPVACSLVSSGADNGTSTVQYSRALCTFLCNKFIDD